MKNVSFQPHNVPLYQLVNYQATRKVATAIRLNSEEIHFGNWQSIMVSILCIEIQLFIFQGAPDLLIRSEAVVICGTDEKNDDDNADSQDGMIENCHQRTPLRDTSGKLRVWFCTLFSPTNTTTSFSDCAFYWRMKSRPEIPKKGETVK